MKEKMIIQAVEETGISREGKQATRAGLASRDYPEMEKHLRNRREILLTDIHRMEDEIRHIDWIIYSLERDES